MTVPALAATFDASDWAGTPSCAFNLALQQSTTMTKKRSTLRASRLPATSGSRTPCAFKTDSSALILASPETPPLSMMSGRCTSYESSLDAGTEDWIATVAGKLERRCRSVRGHRGRFSIFLEDLTLDIGPELTHQIPSRGVSQRQPTAAHCEFERSIFEG